MELLFLPKVQKGWSLKKKVTKVGNMDKVKTESELHCYLQVLSNPEGKRMRVVATLKVPLKKIGEKVQLMVIK